MQSTANDGRVTSSANGNNRRFASFVSTLRACFLSKGMLRPWVLYTGVMLAALFSYQNATRCDFVFDDVTAVTENRDLRPHVPVFDLLWHDFWGTPMQKEQSHKSYRPLCVLTFRWNYYWSQLRPWGYHLTNVLLHALVCLLYLRMCSLFVSSMCSFFAALLFAVHPVHTEAVTGVVGRAELLSSVFFIGAFLLYVRATKHSSKTDWLSMAMCSLLVACAMLSKEQGITVVAVCAVYEVFVNRKLRRDGVTYLLRWSVSDKAATAPSWLRLSGGRLTALAITAVLLLGVRLHVMGAQLPVFTKFDNPAAVSSFPTRHLTYFYLAGANAWLLLCPLQLCCDWTMGTVPLVTAPSDARLAAPLLLCVILGALCWRAVNTHGAYANTVLMSVALMVLPFLPASNLFFPVGFVVAERVLYMPSMGFCLLVAFGFQFLLSSPFVASSSRYTRSVIWLCMSMLLLAHSVRCLLRNGDWISELSVFSSGLRVTRDNAKLYNNVGHALESSKRYDDALRYFRHAVSVQPDDMGAHINVGRMLNQLRRYDEAETAYREALLLLPRAKPGQSYQARIAPAHLKVFLNLADVVARNPSRLHEADALYRRAIQLRSDYTEAYINRGDVLLRLNRTEDAQRVYQQALTYDNTNPDIYYNLGVVYMELGRPSQAHVYMEQALHYNPDHQLALLNSAAMIHESGDKQLRPLAYSRLLRLLELPVSGRQVTPDRVYFILGMLATDDGNQTAAETWFRQAVEVKSDFRSALFNLALLLTESGRSLEAVPYLTRLVDHYPDHVKALVLLGDIYINVLNDLDQAEQCYERIIRLDPDNIQARHNLCVVFVERGKLQAAERCLTLVSGLVASESETDRDQHQYVYKHLSVVRSRLAAAKAASDEADVKNRSTV